MSNLAVVSRVTCNEKSLLRGGLRAGTEIEIISHQSIAVTFVQSHSIHLILSGERDNKRKERTRELSYIHIYTHKHTHTHTPHTHSHSHSHTQKNTRAHTQAHTHRKTRTKMHTFSKIFRKACSSISGTPGREFVLKKPSDRPTRILGWSVNCHHKSATHDP